MGNLAHQTDSKFTIKQANQEAALAALQKAWPVPVIQSLAQALEDDRWAPEIDQQTGDITDVIFFGEKMYPSALGEEDVLFHLAPFVEAGSYIEMADEQSRRWRWLFDGKSVAFKFTKVSW